MTTIDPLWIKRQIRCARPRGRLKPVSDDYIRLVPTDPNWQPDSESTAAVVSYVASLFSGPSDSVDEVKQTFYDRVTLIDAATRALTCREPRGPAGRA